MRHYKKMITPTVYEFTRFTINFKNGFATDKSGWNRHQQGPLPPCPAENKNMLVAVYTNTYGTSCSISQWQLWPVFYKLVSIQYPIVFHIGCCFLAIAGYQ